MSESNEMLSSLNDLKVNNIEDSIDENPLKFSRPKRTLSESSIENLNVDIKQQLYSDRCSIIKEQISRIKISELDVNPEDLLDKYCDPENPVKVTFNDVSAAAYRIRAGIEMTPCTRSHMSEITNMEIYFKKDFLQYTGSFKERGGRYSLLKLTKVKIIYILRIILQILTYFLSGAKVSWSSIG